MPPRAAPVFSIRTGMRTCSRRSMPLVQELHWQAACNASCPSLRAHRSCSCQCTRATPGGRCRCAAPTVRTRPSRGTPLRTAAQRSSTVRSMLTSVSGLLCLLPHIPTDQVSGCCGGCCVTEHTLEPILTGHRVTLVYNLVRTSPGPLPNYPVSAELQRAVDEAVSEWAGLPASEQIAVVPLEHL